jgi:hypothetical protein
MGTDNMISNVIGATIAVGILKVGSDIMQKPLRKRKHKQKGLLL